MHFLSKVGGPSFLILRRQNQGFPSRLSMIKRFPSRNQRSKGIKVKHVIQIILLLGVCLWLIYQVKYNHDKKKEFYENNAKLSVRAETDQILKLGRKDLPVKDEVNQNEKHEEEEEDENIVEDEENKHEHNEQEDEGNKRETEEREENKHGVREQGEEKNKHGKEEQEEENKSEEMEDEGRGGGDDDEIDENDQEKPEVDVDRHEEFMDGEKEKEEGDEKENENSEDEEKVGSVENHNTHEAREEHYKGDDASSAVAHDTNTTSTETGTFSLENTDVKPEENITLPENKTSYSDVSNRNQNNSDLKVAEGELTDGTSNATASKETETNNLFNSLDSSYLNKTATTNSDSHLEASGNMTVVTSEASNNLTRAGTNTSSSSEQNKTMILSESDHAQNTMANTMVTGDVKNVPTEGLEQIDNRVSERSQPNRNSTVSVKTEHGNAGDAAVGESSNLGAGELEKTIKSIATNETENSSRNSDGNESSDASESDKSKGNTETSETNENQNIDATEDEMFKGSTQTDETLDSSLANGISDSVEHDDDDSSDSHIHEDVTEVQTDLDTLPDIRNEGGDDDETTAE